jgi:FkbM family methyltransferase
MKQVIKKIASLLGFQIRRLTAEVIRSDPYVEMSRMCGLLDDGIIFDVGAHHGHAAQLFRKYFPRATIHCFEPFPESFDVLQKRTDDDPGIICHPYGLSNRRTMMDLYSNARSDTNSLLATDPRAAETWDEGLYDGHGTVEAEFRSLDEVMEDLGIPMVTILKIDVQGSEYLVMEGASAACASGNIQMIYSEYITQPTYRGQKRFDEALKVFYDASFDLHNIYNASFTEDGVLRQVDILWKKKPDHTGGTARGAEL